MNHRQNVLNLVTLQNIAQQLIQQGERCALAGMTEQALVLFEQAWSMCNPSDVRLSSTAAWNSACLLMECAAFDKADMWLARVVNSPAPSDQFWLLSHRALVQLCTMRTQAAPEQHSLSRSFTHPVAIATLPKLQVTNLGRFQIMRAGGLLPSCKARKSIRIFRYLLAQRPRGACKEELAELFWPGVDARSAAHSLHVAVSTLRRYLDSVHESYVQFDNARYLIHPDALIEDDCSSFLALIEDAEYCWRTGDLLGAQRAYSTTLALYQGDYFVDDHDFAWAVAERERLLVRYLAVLDRLGRIFMTQQQFEPAIECYQRLLERDEYREDAYCQLIQCSLPRAAQ